MNLPLKILILAAGQKSMPSGGGALELQPLGDCTVIEHVVRNLRGLAKPHDFIVVAAPDSLSAIQKKLGWEPAYIIQEKPLGTGHAVLQASGISERLRRRLAHPVRRHAIAAAGFAARAFESPPIERGRISRC